MIREWLAWELKRLVCRVRGHTGPVNVYGVPPQYPDQVWLCARCGASQLEDPSIDAWIGPEAGYPGTAAWHDPGGPNDR